MKWQLLPFEELYLIPSRNGINRPSRMRGNGYKMINMGELFAYGRIRNPDMELVPLNSREIEEFGVETGDLLFARQSLIASGAGKCSIVVEVPEITVFEGHLIRVRLDQTKADPLFYYYFFSSHEGNGSIQSLVMQVAAAGIRGSELAKLPVPLPPIDIQRRIASILSAYDDLIENNNRRIALLEESMRLLYREWFVRLRFPGHEHVRVVDGLPEGWERKGIGDIVNESRDLVDPNEIEPDTPYVGLEHIPRKSISLSNWGKASDVASSKFRFHQDDILFGKIRPYFHKVVFAPVDGICSSDTIVYRASYPEFFGFALAVISSEDFVNFTSKTSKEGAKMPRANVTEMKMFPILFPKSEILREFIKIVVNLTKQISNLLFTNNKLSEARDLLLPRLMSGEIDVSWEGVLP